MMVVALVLHTEVAIEQCQFLLMGHIIKQKV